MKNTQGIQAIISLLEGDSQSQAEGIQAARKLLGWSFNDMAANCGLKDNRLLRRVSSSGDGELPWNVISELRAHLLFHANVIPEWSCDANVTPGGSRVIHHNIFPRASFLLSPDGAVELAYWASKVVFVWSEEYEQKWFLSAAEQSAF